MRPLTILAAAGLAALTMLDLVPSTQAGWTPIATPIAPPARTGHAAAFDPVGGRIVIFGGNNKKGNLADTWAFNGTVWTQIPTTSAPSARTGARMAFDQITKQLVLFGGLEGNHRLGDTWLFDGATGRWSKAAPQASPEPGNDVIVFTDPLTGHAIAYGGSGGTFYHDETWQWTGTDWVHLSTVSTPGARSDAAAAYDTLRQNVVMFSGLSSINTYDTWTWDGTDWTLQSPAVQPPQRFDSAAEFTPRSNQVILFGGVAGAYVADTWAWDGSGWSQVPTASAPLARGGHTMVFFPPTGQIILFGGWTGTRALPDTWAYVP